MRIEIAHLSDSHLGYEAYPETRSSEGFNQRGKDVVRAMTDCVNAIVSADPDLVVHSGDVLDRPAVSRKYEVHAKRLLEKLAGVRPDGTRRQVVVIAGNHELPRSRKEACWLGLLSGIPGLHVVSNTYDRIRFNGADVPESLADVVVHTLPHDLLKTVDFDGVVPVEGAVNVLTAHGVAGGSDLWKRTVNREHAIPTDVLARDWDYVALGHWHKRGPVDIGGFTTTNTPIWYAGSAERMGFGDLRPGSDERGWLRVVLAPGTESPLRVFPQDISVRPMFKLDPVDLSDVDVTKMTDALVEVVKAHDLVGAIAHLQVTGISRDVYGLVDMGPVRQAAADSLHFKVTLLVPDTPEAVDQAEADVAMAGGIAEALEAELAKLDEAMAEGVRALAQQLLGSALGDVEGDAKPTSSEAQVSKGRVDPQKDAA
ncbi:MAG: DNA repair exonuclease [Actinomycetia bacterium]|nr:DNA repair exonuclease [Actinomycetes bacterium]MCP4845238.1 DNA repair exonuclease [Actinomycetes bacterium]